MKLRNKQKSQKEWQAIIDEYAAQSISATEYCQAKNINLSSFKKWYYKLRKKEKVKADNFTALKIIGSQMHREINSIKIKLPSGIVIEITNYDALKLIKELANAV